MTRPLDDEPTRGSGELRLTLAAEPSAPARLRAELAAFLDRHGVAGDVVYDALLVAHELAANAIRHGSEDDDEIEVRAQLLARRLRLTVWDRARRGSAPVALSPDETRENGRGLRIVDRLSTWSERITEGRRELSAELRLEDPGCG